MWRSFLSWPRVACILHAIVATVLWYVIVMLDSHIVSVRVWTAITLLWLLWLGPAMRAGKGRRGPWVWTLTLGIVILAPTFSTLYSFTVWMIGGFAP
jgi:hypothetical protein